MQNTCAIRPNAQHIRTVSSGSMISFCRTLQEPAPPSGTQCVGKRRGLRESDHTSFTKNTPVPWSKTHEVMRDHLQNRQWATPAIAPDQIARRQARPHLFPQQPHETRFTTQELNTAVDSTKSNKAPGPDEAPVELFVLLDQDSREQLLHMYNENLGHKHFASRLGMGEIVSIPKGKGTDTEAENYRPISLLNTSYKVLAAMLQKRFATQFDNKLRDTQFGFRSHRSTKQPGSPCAEQWSGHE